MYAVLDLISLSHSFVLVFQAIGAPMFGAVGAYAMRKDVIVEKGVVIEGLPFLLGCVMETIGCLLTFMVLRYILTDKDKGSAPEPKKFEAGHSTIGISDVVNTDLVNDTGRPPLYPAEERV